MNEIVFSDTDRTTIQYYYTEIQIKRKLIKIVISYSHVLSLRCWVRTKEFPLCTKLTWIQQNLDAYSRSMHAMYLHCCCSIISRFYCSQIFIWVELFVQIFAYNCRYHCMSFLDNQMRAVTRCRNANIFIGIHRNF